MPIAPVLVPLIMVVPLPMMAAGGVAVLVPLIMVVPLPMMAAGGVAMLVWLIILLQARGILPELVGLIMLSLVPSIMPILVPLIMLVLVPWPHTVEGTADGPPSGVAATAVEAPRAITPAARAPTSKGRLTFCPGVPLVPISLRCQNVMSNSFDPPISSG
jgi:hypothetical protein